MRVELHLGSLMLAIVISGCGTGQDTQPAASQPITKSGGTSSQASALEEEWQEFDAFGRFRFRTPNDVKQRPAPGIDSLVGSFQGRAIRLSFDYGLYSDSLRDSSYSRYPQYQEGDIEIDGKKARMITFYSSEINKEYPYVAAIHFPVTEERGARLTMMAFGKTESDLHVARKVFESIRFGAK